MYNKYRILLAFAFAIGFILATGIGIYKQKKVANKANVQISTANTIISNLQEKQKEAESLKEQIEQERIEHEQSIQFWKNSVSNLQNELANESSNQGASQSKKDGVFIIPSSFPIVIGGNTYTCKSK